MKKRIVSFLLAVIVALGPAIPIQACSPDSIFTEHACEWNGDIKEWQDKLFNIKDSIALEEGLEFHDIPIRRSSEVRKAHIWASIGVVDAQETTVFSFDPGTVNSSAARSFIKGVEDYDACLDVLIPYKGDWAISGENATRLAVGSIEGDQSNTWHYDPSHKGLENWKDKIKEDSYTEDVCDTLEYYFKLALTDTRRVSNIKELWRWFFDAYFKLKADDIDYISQNYRSEFDDVNFDDLKNTLLTPEELAEETITTLADDNVERVVKYINEDSATVYQQLLGWAMLLREFPDGLKDDVFNTITNKPIESSNLKKQETFIKYVKEHRYSDSALNHLKKYEILNILVAAGCEDVQGLLSDGSDDAVPNYASNMDEALSAIAEYKDPDYSDWQARASTWQYRVKYLVSAAYGLSNNAPIDAAISSYYDTRPEDFALYPNAGIVYSKDLGVTNATAYKYLYETMLELPNIIVRTTFISSAELPEELNASESIAEIKDAVVPVTNIINGVSFCKPYMFSDSLDYYLSWPPADDTDYLTVMQLYNYFEKHSLLTSVGDVVEIKKGSAVASFFSTTKHVLSENILQGVAYSSLYTPMVTNVYDAYVLAQQDSEFLKNFHYKYGFQRKALYRDTNVDAAVEMHNTGAQGKRKVCTLRDFLEQEGDTVLYIDDNFYNAKELAEKLDMAFNRLDGAEGGENTQPWYKRLWSSITDWFTVDIYEMTKTAEETEYSHKLFDKLDLDDDDPNNCYKWDAEARETIPDEETNPDDADAREEEEVSEEDEYVMTSDLINYYKEVAYETKDENDQSIIRYRNYSPMFSYAFVSGIYREEALFNIANSEALQKPVYIASADLACMSNASDYEKGSLLNYAMQRNLEANMPIGYSYNIDMDSPIYMDIYGNILTESGVVVVPAASNMTLYNGNYHNNLFSMGLYLVYGKEWSIPCDWNNIEEYMIDSGFEQGENAKHWRVASRTIGDNDVDYARLVTGDTSVNDEVYQYTVAILHQETYNYYNFVNIILEVLRGAPIDSIDKDGEGLNPDHRLSKSGLIAAAKFEELDDALTNVNGNAMMSVPNLAFVDGFEYIALFAFKIIMVVCIVIMLINIFIDVLRSSLSLSTFGHCLGIVVVTVLSVMTIPIVFKVTYYEANRVLLQDETTRIALLNEEKRQQGVEIGVYTVKEPKEETELLVKLEDLDIPWWDLFYRVTTQDVIDQMEELMKDYTQEALTRDMPGVTVMNDGVYITVNDLFDTATVELDLSSKQLYMLSDDFCPASFFSPYYVFLDVLTKRINTYNLQNNWYSYTMKTQRGGRLKTVGLAQAYLTSNEFMEAEDDIFWVTEMHGKTPSLIRQEQEFITSEAAMQMGKSQWANQVGISDDEVEKRARLITKEAQEFVAKYKDLLGKISDETFLKVMALDLAMKHNNLFGVDSARCYEVYKLSQNDLTRLSIANDYQVMTNSTLNYSRFLYEVGGTTAIYAGAFKSLVEWLGSYLKPLATLAIFIIIFVSMFVFKCVWRKEDTNYNGYIITTILLCLVNVAHALLIKLSMYLPMLNLSATVCLIFEAVIELLYLAILGWVLYVSLKDWRNLGMERYMMSMSKFMDKFSRKRGHHRSEHPFRDRLPKNNWEYYDRLVDQRKERG